MYNVWLTMSFFSQIVTVHDGSMTHHLTDFENFWKIFAAEKCSFQVLLQFIFWTVFPCQDSSSIYSAWKLSLVEILLKYSRTLRKLKITWNPFQKVCTATRFAVPFAPHFIQKARLISLNHGDSIDKRLFTGPYDSGVLIWKPILFFEFQKSWMFYFCEWNEIKRNTTEYVGNLGH